MLAGSMPAPSTMYQLRIGCQLNYVAASPTPSVFIVQPPAHPRQMLARQEFEASGAAVANGYTDAFGNRCQRVTLMPGETVVRFNALATVPDEPDEVRSAARQ